MMRMFLHPVAAVMVIFASETAFAAGNDIVQPAMHPALVAPAAPWSPAVSALFAKPFFLRGTLGGRQIQGSLRVKQNIEEGLEGDYFIFGNSQKILLAGEFQKDDLFLNESENGSDVSGQWNGKLEGDTISGIWTSASADDEPETRPFVLKVVRPESVLLKVKENSVSPKINKKTAASSNKTIDSVNP